MNSITEIGINSPAGQPAGKAGYRLALFALAAAAFGIGTTEFVIMGLLPDVARDLAVSIPRAGLLVSGYALGVTFGGPLLAVATAKMERRHALLMLVGIFILGNLLCAIAPNYWLLMGARVVTAFSHGAFFGLGSVVAADLVPPAKRARAIALMFSGLTLANVLGVPFGTALGQAFGWRATFWVVVGIGVIAAIALARWLPRNIHGHSAGLIAEARTLRRLQVWLSMAISTMASIAFFSVFTYITPILEQVAGVSPHGVTLILLLFGIGLTLGNVIGGRLGDWRLLPSLIGVFILLIAIQLVFTASNVAPISAAATIFFWGVLAFVVVPLTQMRVLQTASGAPNLAATMNQSAFNLGNATGAWFGGLAIDSGISYARLPWLGAVLAALGLGLVVITWWLDRRGRNAGGEPQKTGMAGLLPARCPAE